MRPSLLLAALAAGAVNAYERRVYVTDWTAVTVTTTVTAPAVTETVPAANQVQVDYETTTASAAAVETQHSDLSKKSTVIVPESITSSTSTLAAEPTSAAEVEPEAASTSYWSTAWTSTVEAASTTSATSTLATSTSSAAAASTPAANAYQQAILYNHNIHRSNHSAASVDWSSDLETSARALAAKCVYQHDT